MTQTLTKAEPMTLQSVQTTSIESLIAKAIEKDISPETMEKFLVLFREIKAGQAKSAFDEAMAKFQAECPIIEKDKHVDYVSQKGGHVRYSYAPLDSIVRQTKEAIARNGLSYSFNTQMNGSMKVFCIVKHVMGHSESSDCEIEIDKESKMNVSQQSGSTMTYAKRYAFCNAFGILTGDEDNDANDNDNIPPQTTKSFSGGKKDWSSEPATKAQLDFIQKLAKQLGIQVITEVKEVKDAGITIPQGQKPNKQQAHDIIEILKGLNGEATEKQVGALGLEVPPFES